MWRHVRNIMWEERNASTRGTHEVRRKRFIKYCTSEALLWHDCANIILHIRRSTLPAEPVLLAATRLCTFLLSPGRQQNFYWTNFELHTFAMVPVENKKKKRKKKKKKEEKKEKTGNARVFSISRSKIAEVERKYSHTRPKVVCTSNSCKKKMVHRDKFC